MVSYSNAFHKVHSSILTCEAVDQAPVALGGLERGDAAEMNHSLSLSRQFEAQFPAGFGFAVESLGGGRRTPQLRDDQDFHFKFTCLGRDAKQIGNVNFPRRLGCLSCGVNSAKLAGFGCEGAGLEEPGGPEPLVDPDAFHKPNCATKRYDFRFSFSYIMSQESSWKLGEASSTMNSVNRMRITAAVMMAVATSAYAQAPAAYRAPRADGGKPDLNGIWQSLNEANFELEAHMARPAMALRPGPYGPVPAAAVLSLGAVGAVPPGMGIVEGGTIPYKPEALAKRKQNQEKWLTDDPEIKCYLPGVPRANYMPYPFQIFQNATEFFIAYEYAGAVRNVYLKDPGPAPVDSWMGQSVGHWEGETFVIDVTGQNDSSWFDRSGNYHSDKLHVVERYTRTSADVISYEATIEDTEVFTRPWKISMPLYRRQDKGVQLMDFKCAEFVEELIYGQWRKKPLPR